MREDFVPTGLARKSRLVLGDPWVVSGSRAIALHELASKTAVGGDYFVRERRKIFISRKERIGHHVLFQRLESFSFPPSSQSSLLFS